MEEVIKCITLAESKAEEIKAEAVLKSAEIAAAAEAEIGDIFEKCDENCKLYREREIAKVVKEAEESYQKALGQKKAEAENYANSVIKNTDKAVAEIVRRIKSGNC